MQKSLLSTGISSIIFSPAYERKTRTEKSFINKFFTWCALQEKNRFFWLPVCFFGVIGAALPITLLTISFAGGNSILLWIIACCTNVPALALNLAAQPIKVTLPAMFFAMLANAVIIMASLVMFMS